MNTAKAKKASNVIGSIILVALITLIGCMILYPVLAQHLITRYETVLRTHKEISQSKAISQSKWHNQRPFLYVTWFRQGNLHFGESYGAYKDGTERRARFLEYAIQGGGGLAQDTTAFHKLQDLPDLPLGLPGPDAIPHGRLLIVSQHQPDGWHTLYYDRNNLPIPVADIAQTIGVK